ncbi:MAG: hypothetical protein M5U09_18425 [Gammaproteobacteria bacterium]|nr:hypothetical protein [Gammaproteobacteria bacterium]
MKPNIRPRVSTGEATRHQIGPGGGDHPAAETEPGMGPEEEHQRRRGRTARQERGGRPEAARQPFGEEADIDHHGLFEDHPLGMVGAEDLREGPA